MSVKNKKFKTKEEAVKNFHHKDGCPSQAGAHGPCICILHYDQDEKVWRWM